MIKFKIKLFAFLIFPLALQAAAIADWNQKLLEAAQSGNLEQLKEALANNATIDARDNDQYTPLHWATRYGKTEVVNALIEAKATVDAKNYNQWTPLHYAASNGNTEIAKALIESKATIDARNNYQYTPLHYAASDGNTEIVNALILAKANIDARDKYQYTPLHWATRYGGTEIVKALILAKATIDARDNDQWTPLHYAARYGNTTEVLKLLLDAGSNSKLFAKDNKTIFNLISDSWIEPVRKDQLTKIIKDHQMYQESMLIELPKYFADNRNLFNIPTPIAMIITLYAFGICEIDLNKEGNNNDKI